jgi:UDP-2,3-diacylglucosamine hydrolase
MRTLFISDLHLNAERPDITRAFKAFLNDINSDVNALYILGDFFDAWIGDDNDDVFAEEITNELRILSDKGVHIYFVHGNRDFLIGPAFAEKTGVILLPEISELKLAGRRAVLLHGDELCTKDIAYMELRNQIRNPQWQAQVLSQPLPVRRALAAQLRDKSTSMTSLKAQDIMDVTQSEVERVLLEHSATLMIHGHTHRPSRHPFMINEHHCERIVLGDWDTHAWCLDVTEESIELLSWPIS